MRLLKCKTTVTLDHQPRNIDLDDIFFIRPENAGGGARNARLFPKSYDYANDMNRYQIDPNATTLRTGAAATNVCVTDLIRCINAAPNAQVIPFMGTDPATGEVVLINGFEWKNS
tara:strand:+ start:415 stop:759 length:345 start_codon:yes stop_codon:yes gene_type:complete